MFVFVLVRLVAIGRQSIGCGSYASTRGGVGSGFGTGSSTVHFGLETEQNQFHSNRIIIRLLNFCAIFLRTMHTCPQLPLERKPLAPDKNLLWREE